MTDLLIRKGCSVWTKKYEIDGGFLQKKEAKSEKNSSGTWNIVLV